jgi:hypothetical protein
MPNANQEVASTSQEEIKIKSNFEWTWHRYPRVFCVCVAGGGGGVPPNDFSVSEVVQNGKYLVKIVGKMK